MTFISKRSPFYGISSLTPSPYSLFFFFLFLNIFLFLFLFLFFFHPFFSFSWISFIFFFIQLFEFNIFHPFCWVSTPYFLLFYDHSFSSRNNQGEIDFYHFALVWSNVWHRNEFQIRLKHGTRDKISQEKRIRLKEIKNDLRSSLDKHRGALYISRQSQSTTQIHLTKISIMRLLNEFGILKKLFLE